MSNPYKKSYTMMSPLAGSHKGNVFQRLHVSLKNSLLKTTVSQTCCLIVRDFSDINKNTDRRIREEGSEKYKRGHTLVMKYPSLSKGFNDKRLQVKEVLFGAWDKQ